MPRATRSWKLALALLALAASVSSARAEELPPGRWVVETIEGAPLPAGAQPTLEYRDAAVSGSGGCNRYRGAVEIQGARLRIGPVVATRMACSEPAMSTETRFLAALAGVRAFSMEGGRLVLADGAGKVLLLFAPAP